ncbi:MAG: glutaredoxin 3 [Fusobacteriota bacterium]
MDSKKPKIEIYSLNWCPYCRKAKAFFRSKNIEYIEYKIDKDKTKKEMIERSNGSKTVPQIFIDGIHIGGYDDLIKSENSGELNKILGLKPEKLSKVWDLVIVGAGPAGLNAALYAARKGLKVLVLSVALGGQVIETDEVDNWIGSKNISGGDLMQRFWEHVEKYDVKIKLGIEVIDILEKENFKIIKSKNSEFKTRTVIIATGTHNRSLGVSGEHKLKGRGVHYCAICDGYLYAGEKVAVVGGGNSGLEAALDMAKLGSNVNLIELQDRLMGDDLLQEKVNKNKKININTGYEIENIKGDDHVEEIEIRDIETGEYKNINVNAVFVEIGLIPNSGFLNHLIKINDINEIIINQKNETNIKGIWAAGDVTNIKDKQIIVSAAEGAKSALRVNEYLQLQSN